MADREELFDEEPARSETPASGGPPDPGRGVSRRQFLVGAGSAAAAGAAIGAVGSIGIIALLDKDDVAQQVSGLAPGTPAGEMPFGYPGYLGGVPAGIPLEEAVIQLNVNGKTHRVGVAPNMSLAEVLRQQLGLIGTKIGCDRSECSACTVLIDGVPANSCSVLAIREEGKQITTIEGLARDGKLNPVQEGFVQEMGLQCGFCTPGQVMNATALLLTNPEPGEATVKRALSGNLCKCSAYPNILRSVNYASQHWNGWSL
jgi:aerobic-type carbon monoxide dehydrogenase small subunit (CoxS/CutS family)